MPIVTFCPVNHLPDLVYIEVEFDDEKLHELYGIRKKIRELVRWKTKFMEAIAEDVFTAFPGCKSVTVTLAFGRHVVIRYGD